MRRTCWLVPLILGSLGAEPPPIRVPARPVPPDQEARRHELAEFAVGRLLQRRQNTPAALKRFEAVAKADPQSLPPRRELVSLYADLGRDSQAIRIGTSVLDADPADADTAHTVGRLLFGVKRFSEAAEVFARGADSPRLSTRPMKAFALLSDAARCRDRTGDAAARVTAWQALVRFLDANTERLQRDGLTAADARFELAVAQEKLGTALLADRQFDAAAKAFEAARAGFADPKGANNPAAAARGLRNLAELSAARGDASAAVGHQSGYLKHGPTDPEPYQRYTELLRAAGRAADVVPELTRLTAERPKLAAIRWVLLAETARRDGWPTVANEFTAIAERETRPEFFALLTATLVQTKSPDGWLAVAGHLFPNTDDKARTKPPESETHAARRRLFADAFVAEPAFAVAVAGVAATTSGVSSEVWELIAWGTQRAGRPNATLNALRQQLRTAGRGQDAFRAFLRLRAHLYQHRRWQDILELCDSTAGISEGVRNYYRAAPLAELGREEAAFEALEAAGNDNAFVSRREKIRVWEILGRYPEMLTECEKAFDEFRTPSEVLSVRYLRAVALQGLKRFADAEAELRGILDDVPDDALALNNLGYNLADQNRKLDDAEAFIRRAIAIDRDERVKAGESTLEHAAYLDSLAWVRFRQGHLSEARELLERTVRLPDGAIDPTVWDHLGDVAFRQGDRDRAKTAWTEAIRGYESSHVGRSAGRLDEAKRKVKLARPDE